MENIKFLCILSIWTLSSIGCKKEEGELQPVASIRSINALIDGGTVKLNTNERDSVRMYNSRVFGLALVNQEATIQILPTAAPGKSYYNNKISMEDGDIYSLFLFGWPANVESLLIKEQVPGFYVDSVIGIRVAHCAPGGLPVNITLKKDPTVPLFQQVNYKTVTDIVKVPLPRVVPVGGAIFEVRDAANNKILATYSLPTASASSTYPGISVTLQRFKNLTLVIKGSRDTLSGPNAFGVFPAPVSY